MYNFSQMTGVGLSTRLNEVWVDARAYSPEELVNLVSEETLTRKRNEVRAEQEKARVLQAESAKIRADAEQLQREEKRLGAQADDLDKEVVEMEWQEPTLEQEIADLERTHAIYLRESADFEGSINRYLSHTTRLRNQEAGLRLDAEHKRREVERLREQAGQDCVSGIDHRMRGNLAQANPIQVEQLICEADCLDRESSAHLSQIEKNNDKVQFLMSHAMARISFRGELVQAMADLQTQLTGLRSQLQETTV